MESKKYTEISYGLSFREILLELFNRKYIVIGIVVLSVLCSFAYTKFFIKRQYVACAKLLITKNVDDGQQLNTSDLSISYYLIRDYTEIILDKTVLSRVSKELDLPLSAGSLKSSIRIENPSNSRVLEIYVTADTPENAQKIANKVCEVSKEEIFKIVKQDTVNIMSTAGKPNKPSGPNILINLFYGFIGGLIIAMIAVSLIAAFDDALKGKKEIKKYLGLEVLSVIPYMKPNDNSGKNTVRGSKNGRD